MPTARRLSTIAAYGSSLHAADGRFEPRLRLIAAILCSHERMYRCSRAARMSDENAATHDPPPAHTFGSVTLENAWTASTFAPLATPENDWPAARPSPARSEEHTSELQSLR